MSSETFEHGQAGPRPDTPIPYGEPVEQEGHDASMTLATSSTTAKHSRQKGKARSAGNDAPLMPIYPEAPYRARDRGDTDSDSVSSDDDRGRNRWGNLEADMAMLWKRHNIFKPRRQDWIRNKARGVVIDHERKFRLQLTEVEFDELFITATESIAKQYVRASLPKASSCASTALSHSYTGQATATLDNQARTPSAGPGPTTRDHRQTHVRRMSDRDTTITPVRLLVIQTTTPARTVDAGTTTPARPQMHLRSGLHCPGSGPGTT